MILSHKNRYIFLKTTKVGGTSLEIALSRHCGERDIISAISAEDEITRQQLGFPGAQNHKKNISEYGIRDYARLLLKAEPACAFYNHMPAAAIKSRVGDQIWGDYLKFSVVRNPYDYAVSRFFWDKRNGNQASGFRDYLLSNPEVLLVNRKITRLGDACCVDFMLRYEHFATDLVELSQKIALPGNVCTDFMSLSAKGGIRPATASVDEMFAGFRDGVELVKILCREDIERYGYAPPGKPCQIAVP